MQVNFKDKKQQKSFESMMETIDSHIKNYPNDSIFWCSVFDYQEENGKDKVAVLSKGNEKAFVPIAFLMAQIIKNSGLHFLESAVAAAKSELMDENSEFF